MNKRISMSLSQHACACSCIHSPTPPPLYSQKNAQGYTKNVHKRTQTYTNVHKHLQISLLQTQLKPQLWIRGQGMPRPHPLDRTLTHQDLDLCLGLDFHPDLHMAQGLPAIGRGNGYASRDPVLAAASIAGPPGYGRPSRAAVLSNASPIASSTVAPRI